MGELNAKELGQESVSKAIKRFLESYLHPLLRRNYRWSKNIYVRRNRIGMNESR